MSKKKAGKIKVVMTVFSCLLLASCSVNPPGAFTQQWQAERKIGRVELKNGTSIRYLQSGQGPVVLLIHTIRTQLDYFKDLIPLLEKKYTVYAIDLPGHGYSSLKDVEYTEPFMRTSVEQFIEKMGLKNIIVVGESIGGVLSLTLAAEMPDRITRVVSLNPYDYGEDFGGGVRRSDHGWLVGFFNVFGRYTWEPEFILGSVLSGGFYDSKKLPEPLLEEFVDAGKQDGFRRAEYSVFRNWKSWLNARELYNKIKVPVTLVYGSNDWSTDKERKSTAALIPGARMFILEKTGHFASIENPQQVYKLITRTPQ